ncbi:MAG TPA: transposase [Spirochaetota bacterium]|nr:transposase [Spirochaetota bacterium]
MARKHRICAPGLTYHAMSRCIENSEKMKSDKVKNIIVEVINMALDKYSFEFINYSILNNHFHFTIRTVERGETISRIMQYIKSLIARKYNKMMNRIGPLWNERFKDRIVEHSDNPPKSLFTLIWYQAFNAVRKGHVLDPRHYRYSSINAYLDENYQSPIKITLHPYFMALGNSFTERVKKFLVYEEMYRKRIDLIM